jgi:transcriptional regulator with PAS, ATPase and Fis domain
VESKGLGFQKQAKEEVVVTDAKLEIVFASHNMTKMNGYVEEEVIGKAKNVSRGHSNCINF